MVNSISAGPYLENYCLFQSKPPAYGSAAHRSAHQMMTMVAKQVSRVPPLQPGKASYEDFLPLPLQMQAMILQSTDVNCALEEVCTQCGYSLACGTKQISSDCYHNSNCFHNSESLPFPWLSNVTGMM